MANTSSFKQLYMMIRSEFKYDTLSHRENNTFFLKAEKTILAMYKLELLYLYVLVTVDLEWGISKTNL